MKQAKHYMAMVLAVIALASLIAIPVAAADPNTSDTSHQVIVTNAFRKDRPIRQKNNTTPVYLLIDSSSFAHTYVQAQGCSSDGLIRTNFTSVEGNNVSQVVCRMGVKYSVHTTIYEEGYRYASLDFKHLNASYSGSYNLTYTWSPDSTREYTDAT